MFPPPYRWPVFVSFFLGALTSRPSWKRGLRNSNSFTGFCLSFPPTVFLEGSFESSHRVLCRVVIHVECDPKMRTKKVAPKSVLCLPKV